jgi:hypothetical protein
MPQELVAMTRHSGLYAGQINLHNDRGEVAGVAIFSKARPQGPVMFFTDKQYCEEVLSATRPRVPWQRVP